MENGKYQELTETTRPSVWRVRQDKRWVSRRWWVGTGLVSLLVGGLGCARVQLPSEIPPPPEQSRIVLQDGDELEVKFRYWPELDERQMIRPDGKISLHLVDEVMVAGLTPEELDQHLTGVYEEHIKDPVLTVFVRSLADRHVYVGGEVENPGLVPLRGRMTALAAIMAAGGFVKESADLKNVVLVRHIQGRRYAGSFDLSKSFSETESAPLWLAPNDILFVSPTRIDDMTRWVDQYINNLIPETGLRFTRTLGSTTYGYSIGD